MSSVFDEEKAVSDGDWDWEYADWNWPRSGWDWAKTMAVLCAVIFIGIFYYWLLELILLLAG